jgi:hypothetical protein
MLLGVASTSLAGAGRGGRAVHRWVRCHISIARVSLDACMMRRHTITVLPAMTYCDRGDVSLHQLPQRPDAVPSRPAIVDCGGLRRGGGFNKKNLPYGLERGWSTSADVGGRYVGGGDDGNESMMAATGVERRTKAKGGQQQRTAVYCGGNGSGRRQMSADGGERRRRFDRG